MKKSMEDYKIELEKNVTNVEKWYVSLENDVLLPKDLKKQVEEIHQKTKNVFTFLQNVASKGIEREEVLNKIKEEAYHLRKDFGGFFAARLHEIPLEQKKQSFSFRDMNKLNEMLEKQESDLFEKNIKEQISDQILYLFLDWKNSIEETFDCFTHMYEEIVKQEYEISEFEKEKFQLEIRHLEKKSSIL